MTFTVATWNVLWRDRASRLGPLAERLRGVRPDVVMLQESSPAHARDVAEALGMRVAAVPDVPPTDSMSVPALLTTAPAFDGRVTELPNPFGNHAYYCVSAATSADGIWVRFASTHLRHTPLAGRMGLDPGYRAAALGLATAAAIADAEIRESVSIRLAQLPTVTAAVADARADATIIAGDFNFLPGGPEYRWLTGDGWRDAWRHAPRLGSGATVVDRNPLISDGPHPYRTHAAQALPGADAALDYTLDFQFSRGVVSAGAAWIIGDPGGSGAPWPSDHLGLVVKYAPWTGNGSRM